LSEREAANQRLLAELHAAAMQSEESRATLSEREADNQRLLAELHATTKQSEESRATLREREADNQRLLAELHATTKQSEESRAALIEREVENRLLKTMIDGIHNSRSWRGTKPFRILGYFFKRILTVNYPRTPGRVR
jgi:hypothetical protein